MRLPLVPRSEVTPSQKALYDAYAKRVATFTSFRTMREDGALLGPWSVWLQIPKTGDAIRQFIEIVEAMPGLSKAAAQVVTLVTAAHFNAAYELYAHTPGAIQVGLSDSQVATLSAGEIPSGLDPECQLAAQIARRLLRGGVLPGPLYKQAVAILGQDGLNRVVFQVGQYCLVSITLNAFDVPIGDE